MEATNPPIRKTIRLPDYDYTSNGAYFVTICRHEKQNTLWNHTIQQYKGAVSKKAGFPVW